MARKQKVNLPTTPPPPTEDNKLTRVGEIIAKRSSTLDAFSPPPGAPTAATKDVAALQREAEILSATLIEEERELGRQNFWYFLTQILFPTTWQDHYTEVFHEPLCLEAQNLEPGCDLWVLLQRQARKSYILSFARNVWSIVRDPNIRILLVGAREETVKPWARLTRSVFEKHTPGFEKFQKVYSDFISEGREGRLRQAFQFTVKTRNRPLADPTFRATYLGVTGAGWRCDILNFDDPIERRNTTTPEQSSKALGQMLDLLPLVDTTSAHRNIIGEATRWAYHDPMGHILGETNVENVVDEETLERFKQRKIKVIARHAFENPSISCTHCPKHIVELYPHGHPVSLDDPDGVPPLFPIWTRERLMDELTKYRADQNKGESLWWHQFQNVCLAPSAQKFSADWFYDLEVVGWRAVRKRIMAIDSADKDFQKVGRGDYMVALAGEFDENGRLLLRHGLRSNAWTRDEFIRRILSWCMVTNWWPSLVVKEKTGNDTFLTDLGRSFLGHQRPVHLKAVTRVGGLAKADFITEALQGPMERGEVVWGSVFPRDLRSRAQYELTNLGQVTHDDIADALAFFFIPGIRVAAPNRAFEVRQTWRPPDLNLYDPGVVNNAPAPPIKSPFEIVMDRPSAQALVADLGFSEVNWDQAPLVPGPMNLDRK